MWPHLPGTNFTRQPPRRGCDFVLADVPLLDSPEWSSDDESPQQRRPHPSPHPPQLPPWMVLHPAAAAVAQIQRQQQQQQQQQGAARRVGNRNHNHHRHRGHGAPSPPNARHHPHQGRARPPQPARAGRQQARACAEEDSDDESESSEDDRESRGDDERDTGRSHYCDDDNRPLHSIIGASNFGSLRQQSIMPSSDDHEERSAAVDWYNSFMIVQSAAAAAAAANSASHPPPSPLQDLNIQGDYASVFNWDMSRSTADKYQSEIPTPSLFKQSTSEEEGSNNNNNNTPFNMFVAAAARTANDSINGSVSGFTSSITREDTEDVVRQLKFQHAMASRYMMNHRPPAEEKEKSLMDPSYSIVNQCGAYYQSIIARNAVAAPPPNLNLNWLGFDDGGYPIGFDEYSIIVEEPRPQKIESKKPNIPSPPPRSKRGLKASCLDPQDSVSTDNRAPSSNRAPADTPSIDSTAADTFHLSFYDMLMLRGDYEGGVQAILANDADPKQRSTTHTRKKNGSSTEDHAKLSLPSVPNCTPPTYARGAPLSAVEAKKASAMEPISWHGGSTPSNNNNNKSSPRAGPSSGGGKSILCGGNANQEVSEEDSERALFNINKNNQASPKAHARHFSPSPTAPPPPPASRPPHGPQYTLFVIPTEKDARRSSTGGDNKSKSKSVSNSNNTNNSSDYNNQQKKTGSKQKKSRADGSGDSSGPTHKRNSKDWFWNR